MPIINLTNPVFISVTKAGRVNSGGTVGVYEADGLFTTLATVWSDQVKTTELSNPVTLDDAGTKEILYDVKVDIREKTKADVLIRDTLNLDPNAGNAVVQGFNLAQNGSFEIDSTSDGQPDNWTVSPYPGSSIAITESVVTDGVKALEFNTTGAGSGGGVATSAKFPVTEGSICSVAWSFFATHASTLNTFLVKWYDEDGVASGTPSTTLAMPASGSVPASWTRYSDSATVPADATQGEIVLTGVSSGGSNLNSKAYFDGILLTNQDTIVDLTLTTPTLTSPVINTQATGTGIKDEDDMVSDSAVHLVTQQSVKAFVDNKVAGLNTKIIDIGDWNMDATSSVNILHGLDSTKIRTVSVFIRKDTGGFVNDFMSNSPTGATSHLITFDATVINLTRPVSGFFDNTNYDSTSYNRGWITIQYTD